MGWRTHIFVRDFSRVYVLNFVLCVTCVCMYVRLCVHCFLVCVGVSACTLLFVRCVSCLQCVCAISECLRQCFLLCVFVCGVCECAWVCLCGCL